MNKPTLNKKKMIMIKVAAENKRQWHANFIDYTEFMVKHPNYNGLFFKRTSDNRVQWVVAGNSEKGRERRRWWDQKCIEHGIKIEAGAYAKIASKIHPTKKHTCQICGKELSIEYVYPNKRTIASIKKEFGFALIPFEKDIYQIVNEFCSTELDIEKICKILNITSSISSKQALIIHLRNNFLEYDAKGLLSPGAMSNSPDRFDGFHSDGACCRHKSDKGRGKSNLQRYGQDRRAYENWADGNWKMADRLMSLFRKKGVSADHIGPISLGFCHRPKFHPLTKSDNAAKNNRMSLADIKVLLADEKIEQVVSFHSKYIWDKLKGKVSSDDDAVKLSALMRKNLHYVLILFSKIDENGYGQFLEQFLNPEYSFYDYEFEGFDSQTGTFKTVKEIKKKGQNQKNNIKRYFRVAFETLEKYKKQEKRKTKIWKSSKVDDEVRNLLKLLQAKREGEALNQLKKVFEELANLAEESW